jgi:hypothetical protein
MSTAEISRPQRLVLYGEPWEAYVRLLHLFDERRHLRITYDRGALEIMTLSPEHEQWRRLIGRLIVALTAGFAAGGIRLDDDETQEKAARPRT